jgi:hypothetical protein
MIFPRPHARHVGAPAVAGPGVGYFGYLCLYFDIFAIFDP